MCYTVTPPPSLGMDLGGSKVKETSILSKIYKFYVDMKAI